VVLDLPKSLTRTKDELRSFLRANMRESEWTVFQGALYGPGMRYAEPFDGAIDMMQQLVTEGHDLVIISHRTRHPYAGHPHDLHGAARRWVEEHLQKVGLFIGENQMVNFFETRREKIACIAALGCQVFMDDLPEVLNSPDFPAETVSVLFDPSRTKAKSSGFRLVSAWAELHEVLLTLG